MVRKYFGTDGIRGTANKDNMTAAVALRVGMAAGSLFTRGSHRHTVVIGKDTRLSGYMLEPALAAGFIGMGMDVIFLGPIPTPAVSMLTRSLRADLGVMISASHNEFSDNGIKLFGPDGYKLDDSKEEQIETIIESDMHTSLAEASKLGRAKRLEDAQGRYIEFVKSTFPKGRRLDGLKIVVDCANGAAYKVAPTALWELGAEIICTGIKPDGFNINKGCGSTNTTSMCDLVQKHGANLGIALDGDADRVIMSDENGLLLDGDQLMAAVAESWHADGRLRGSGIVTTVMSNLGLERYLTGLGLKIERTQVGDRYVVEHMKNNGFNVGGEQSGHIILSDYMTTGDGLIAALELLALMVRSDKPISDIGRKFEPLPQVLENVPVANSSIIKKQKVIEAVDSAKVVLGSHGRLLVRNSGTESVVRVMAEGDDITLVRTVVDGIVSVINEVRNA